MRSPDGPSRAPSGPRGRIGAVGEEAAAAYLLGLGWSILERNVRLTGVEVDIVAHDPSSSETVITEVRVRTTEGFADPVESLDRRKVARLYRAGRTWAAETAGSSQSRRGREWRVDLVAMRRDVSGRWSVTRHIRGLESP